MLPKPRLGGKSATAKLTGSGSSGTTSKSLTMATRTIFGSRFQNAWIALPIPIPIPGRFEPFNSASYVVVASSSFPDREGLAKNSPIQIETLREPREGKFICPAIPPMSPIVATRVTSLRPSRTCLAKVAPENINPDVGAGIGLIQLRKVWHVSLIRALRQGFHKLMHSSLVIVTLGHGPFFSESADASVRLGLLHASFLLHHPIPIPIPNPSDRRVLLKKRPKKYPDERRLHFLVLRERRSSSSVAGEATTDWISDDMGALMVLKARPGRFTLFPPVFRHSSFVSIYDAIDHLDIAAEKECCLSALSTFASPAWVSLTDLNHETKNHAYEAISISIVQPEVTATEDGVEFEQHSFDLLSKRLAWRDRKDALLKRDTKKKVDAPMRD
ncbi:hypothetical protein Lal_00019659 [Lupinus albus]|nr:hypothetical protein Lal_00019659 [Lupinus albus]